MRKLTNEQKVTRKLRDFYNATMDALSKASRGHNNGWDKVQKISNEIEDNFNLDEI
jgi:hypothetical protein